MRRLWRFVLTPLALTVALSGVVALRQARPETLDPLYDACAYSLYVKPDGWDSDNHFPLGVLFPRDDNELASYGFDFTERAVSPLLDPTGGHMTMDWFVTRHPKASLPPPSPNHIGLFTASWGWHLMQLDQNVPGYGTFAKTRSYFDPNVRRYLIAADTALAKTYGAASRPTLAWSLDNEWEGALDDSPVARTGFISWLRTSYGTLAKLNAAWETNYADWSAIVPPKSEPKITRPAAWLDWHAYQDGYFTQMTADRYRALYENDPLHRPVAYKSTQQSYDLPAVGKNRVLDPAQLCDLTRPSGGWYGVDIYDADDSYIYQVNFAAQCIRPLESNGTGKLFLTETNNHGGPGYEFANSIWRTLGNGAKAYDLFCFGMAGATDDSDIYGLTAPNTTLRGKAPYAARFAYAVRRTEAFWEKSKPASGVHRVALLLNRPDMLLDDDTPGNIWAGPKNSRSAVYTSLRKAGYWVDVIPYTKLNANFLRQYDALFLVGGDHISPESCGQITNYVRQGGVLVADMLAGYYDTRHQVKRGLEPVLGVHVASATPEADYSFSTPAGTLHGTGHTAATTAPTVRRSFGKGQALYINTRLGTLKGDTEAWLSGLLQSAGVVPGYAATGGSAATASLRVEQPFTSDGNIAFIVANLKKDGHNAASLEVQLPPGEWKQALWSPAENEALQPVTVSPLPGGRYKIDLPAFATAGMLLFFPHHDPLISISDISTPKRGIDGYLPTLTPGLATPVVATLYNPSATACPGGSISVRALQGWKLSDSTIQTPAIPPYGQYRFEITITAPENGVLPYAERMYPILMRWSDGKADKAVTATPVGVDIDNTKCPYLLTENATYPTDYPRKLKTGATYRYLFPEEAQGAEGIAVADPAEGKAKAFTALQGGESRWLMASESAHFELPSGGTVPIEFDLKGVHNLHAIRLLSSAFGGYPTKMDVSVSADGVHFTKVGSAVPADGPGSGKWLELQGLEGTSGRYVRLDVGLQDSKGYINEVEIWGYP